MVSSPSDQPNDYLVDYLKAIFLEDIQNGVLLASCLIGMTYSNFSN